jgi:hypothetical protein
MTDIQMVVNDNKRRLKSLTERILLIDADVIYVNSSYDNCISGIYCKILGASNKIYIVEVWKEYDYINSICSCPDFIIRNCTCKHIYWLGSKKFDCLDPCEWSVENYNSLIREYWLNETDYNIIGRNETCPICLDDIDYENDMTICCKYECYNAVHSVCWSRLYSISGKTNCVICRTDTMPIIADNYLL